MNRSWAVFVSGKGSNLKNFLEIEASGRLNNQRLSLVVADKACPALEIAKSYGKPQFVLSPKEEAFSDLLIERLYQEQISDIFLMGYMRVLPLSFVSKWRGLLVNIHPSLLPKYKGLRAVERAYAAGDRKLGVSLHHVVEHVDSGELIDQRELLRQENESLEDIFVRIHSLEHQIVEDFLIRLESEASAR